MHMQAFDKVGTLVHLKIDMSHNNLNQLRSNRTTNFPTSSNIMYLDLSWNNISMIETGFFDPVQNVLKVRGFDSSTTRFLWNTIRIKSSRIFHIIAIFIFVNIYRGKLNVCLTIPIEIQSCLGVFYSYL